MLTKMKAILAATAVAGVLATTGAAGASAATITGGGAFDATATTSSRLVNTTSGLPLNCTDATGSGTAVNGTYTPPAAVGTLTPTFDFCTGPSGLVFVVSCTPVANSLSITGNPVGGTTAGTGVVDCTITFIAGSACEFRVQGSVDLSYTNPPGGVLGNGSLTVFTAGQSLTVTSTNGNCGFIAAVNDEVTYGAPVGMGTGLTDITYDLDDPGPTIS